MPRVSVSLMAAMLAVVGAGVAVASSCRWAAKGKDKGGRAGRREWRGAGRAVHQQHQMLAALAHTPVLPPFGWQAGTDQASHCHNTPYQTIPPAHQSHEARPCHQLRRRPERAQACPSDPQSPTGWAQQRQLGLVQPPRQEWALQSLLVQRLAPPWLLAPQWA